MNKYTFAIHPEIPRKYIGAVDEVQFKILAEECEPIRIITNALSLEEALKKANEQVQTLIEINFRHIENFELILFKISILELDIE